MSAYPSRIVCLTEETTETLYLLGAGDRVVGVSGYTARPPEARHKPRVSAYLNANYDRIAVFIEEWDDPLISGIRWVEEPIAVAGGDPIYPELRSASMGRDRIVDPAEVVRRRPDVIIASWCGKKVRVEKIAGRKGWTDVPAVREGHIYEIKSAYILQPGPAALTDGVRQLYEIISRVAISRETRSPSPAG